MVDTGRYVDGKKNGLWEIRLPYGSVEIGHYVNGERHGVWEIQEFNGPVHTGRFVNDNQHGKWVGRWPDDRKTVTTCYEHGIAHGKAERRFAGGEVQISRFVDGKMVEFDGKPVDE